MKRYMFAGVAFLLVLLLGIVVLALSQDNSSALAGQQETATPAILATPGQIVFSSNQDGDNYDIYIMNADGSNMRNLTQNDVLNSGPSWSPDGSQIVFVSQSSFPSVDIFAMNADGSNLRQLTQSDDQTDSRPSWSPDGSRIAFLSSSADGRMVGVMDADGSNVHILTPDLGAAAASTPISWSPDGTRLAFSGVEETTGKLDIYVVNADGSDFRNVTQADGHDMLPDWSPVGEQIAFMSDRDGNLDIYVISADGSDLRNLTNDPAQDKNPQWSPDGTQIVFDSLGRSDSTDIYVINADGSNLRNLTNDDRDDYSPVWSPDGRQIFFTKIINGDFSDRDIYVVNADGSNPLDLTPVDTYESEADQWMPAVP